MRLAFFSPLPPSPTGIALFSMDLLERLTRRMEVEIFVEDTRSGLAAPQWPVFSHQEFAARERKKRFDAVLYQMGNNRLHHFVYRAALERRGVVDLHDALLQHLFLGYSWDVWAEEFAYVYGPRGREIAANLRGGNMGAHEGFFRYPLVKRLVESSAAVVVHNPGAVERVQREVPGANIHVVPLLFATREREWSREAARLELGLPQDAFLVGFFGYVREPRRLPLTLRAFQAMRRQVPRAEFLLVGDGTAEGPGIRQVGHVPDTAFEQYGAACDAVVNLRYPSAGETSSISVCMMGLGVPVLMSDIPENAPFPDDACLKVPYGEIEEPLVLEYLLELARHPQLGAAIGANAQRHVREVHDPDSCTQRYVDILESAQSA